MNNFISKILIFIFILISCSNSSVNNKNESDDNTEKEKISNEINYTDIEFEVNAIPFDIVDIEKNNYTNIDNRVIDGLNAYKTFTNDIVNINGSKYYILSVYTLNIDDESFYEKLENEHYIYVSLWKLNNNNANFVAGFYPFTMYSYDVEYIKPYISNNMLEFEILRYARKYEYTDYYKFAIIETNNIINFYLTNFTEKTPEYDDKTDETKIAEYSFDKDNIIMNNLNKNYDY